MSSARRKGTAWETAVVRWLHSNGFATVERRAQHGAGDLGDIVGLPGVVIECKATKELRWPRWAEELRTEIDNAGAHFGLVAVKAQGKSSPGEGYWQILPEHVPYVLRAIEAYDGE